MALHSHFVVVLAAGAAELVEGTGSNVLDSTGLAFAVVEVVAAQLAIASVVLAASVLASVEPAFAVVAFAALAIAATAVVAVAASGGRNKMLGKHNSCELQVGKNKWSSNLFHVFSVPSCIEASKQHEMKSMDRRKEAGIQRNREKSGKMAEDKLLI